MKMRSKGFAAAVAALLWAGAASAGTLYLPVAVNGSLDGKTYTTYLWITNTGNQVREVALRYIPTGKPGLEGAPGARVTVGPGQTFKVIVGEPGVGMVEVDGEDDLIYAARMDSFSAGGTKQSRGNLPLIGASDVHDAGAVAHLQGGERAVAGSASHLGIAVFGGEDGQCTIKVFRADGSQVNGTAAVWAPALGQRWFQDVFALLGEPSIGDARFEISCDVPFFPLSASLGAAPDSTGFALPSAVGADSLVPKAPGPKAGELVRKNGVFFLPIQGASLMEVPLPIAAGVEYSSISFEFDMYVFDLPGNPSPAANFTGTVILLRPGRGGTFMAHTIRANGVNKTILDLGYDELARGNSGIWDERVQYHVKVNLNTDTRQLTWQLFRGASLVETVVGHMNNRALMHSGEGLKLIFGLDKVYDHGGYLPPWGYRFSNLVASGVPAP